MTSQGLFIYPEAPVGAVLVGFRAFRLSGGRDISEVRLVLIYLNEAVALYCQLLLCVRRAKNEPGPFLIAPIAVSDRQR